MAQLASREEPITAYSSTAFQESVTYQGPGMSTNLSADSFKGLEAKNSWITRIKSSVVGVLTKVNKELWLILSLLLIAGIINYLITAHYMLLGFYTLPALFSAYLYGRRHAILTAFASVFLVGLLAYYNTDLFTEAPTTQFIEGRWYEILAWAGILVITAYAIGTLHEEAEERYRMLVDTSPDIISEISAADGKITSLNPAFEKITGWPKAEWIGKSFISIVHPDDVSIATKRYEQFLRGENSSPFELRVLSKSCEELFVEFKMIPEIKKGKVTAYFGFVRDVTERKRAEKELEYTLEKLRKGLAGTVQAIAMTVETRDPYTAGHQRRVADLARAIATEMGLSKERIDGIRMAGIIHDMGKIPIPAEILSKPGQLTEIEFGIIRTHAKIGYDILKNIDFPWPVAQIVLQHHERIDGSGYPGGLSSENILLEARILGVADVVEAMASHRPYRPALGIDKALDEISQNRGGLYDPRVVDACLKLFAEKGFEFK